MKDRGLFARRRSRASIFARARRNGTLGVTLMELLVVISLIGMLLALLLPAVSASREAARLNSCKSNLRQLGLALLNHEAAFQRLPSGGWGFQWYGDPDRGSSLRQPGGWAFSVLPYLERRDLSTYGAGQSGKNKLRAVAQINETPVRLFYCPTRRAPGAYPFDMKWPPRNAAGMAVAAKTDYAINGGDYLIHAGGGPKDYTEADDPNYRWPDTSKGNGVCYAHTQVSLNQVHDGTSQTYLLGEKNVSTHGLDLGDDQSLFVGYDLDNTRWTTLGVTPLPDDRWFHVEHFGSAHPGACLFVFCDGAVHEVSFSIDAEVHRRLGNRRDAQIIEAEGW